MAFREFIAPQRGHLIFSCRKSASASFLLQFWQRISFTLDAMRVGFGPLRAQYGALAKRRPALREVATPSVTALGVVAPSHCLAFDPWFRRQEFRRNFEGIQLQAE